MQADRPASLQGDGMKKLNQQDGTYQANEGIWIGAICEAMKLARR